MVLHVHCTNTHTCMKLKGYILKRSRSITCKCDNPSVSSDTCVFSFNFFVIDILCNYCHSDKKHNIGHEDMYIAL